MKSAAALTIFLATACVPEEGPLMAPFQDCLGCHTSGSEARGWSVAGTWSKGARVTLVDRNGKSVTLTGNQVGNFYTAEGLAFPVTVSVDGQQMPRPITYGGCNACHRGETVTTGPEMAAGQPCLGCHGPGGMAATKFWAAGTFAPAGQTVNVAGRTTTTNAVGNFYFEYTGTPPVSFTARQSASVAGQAMGDGGAPSGDCNACHGSGREAGDD